MIKNRFLFFALGVIFLPSIVFAQSIGGTKTGTEAAAVASTATTGQANAEYQSTCVSAAEPIVCTNAATALSTATTACKASAITGAAGSLSSGATGSTGSSVSTLGSVGTLAGPLIACQQIMCDASSTEKNTCSTTCTTGCTTSYGCECDDPYTSETACPLLNTCNTSCSNDLSSDSTVNCSNLPSTSSTSATPYNTCITSLKSKAKLLQTKCRKLCESTAMQASSSIVLASTIVSGLGGLQSTITGGNNNGGGSGNTYTPPSTTPPPAVDNTPTPYVSGGGGAACASSDAKCNCLSVAGATWDGKKCNESGSSTPKGLTASNLGTGTSASGTGAADSDGSGSASGTGIAGSYGANVDASINAAGNNANGKNPSGTGAGTGAGSANGGTGSRAGGTGVDNDESGSDLSANGASGSGIAGQKANLFDLISKIYTGKYNEKELGLFASKSDKDKGSSTKKVTRDRSKVK